LKLSTNGFGEIIASAPDTFADAEDEPTAKKPIPELVG